MLSKPMILLMLCKIRLIHNTMNSTRTCASIFTTHHDHRVKVIGVVDHISVPILAYLTSLNLESVWN